MAEYKLHKTYKGYVTDTDARRPRNVIIGRTPEGFMDVQDPMFIIDGLVGKNVRLEIYVEEKDE